MDRRVDVGEGPFVGGDLAVWMHVPLAQKEDELFLRERRIDPGEGNHVEGRVPGGVPGVLPLVRHRNDVPVVEVRPITVPAVFRFGRSAFEPLPDDVMVKLFGPDHPGVRLA